VLEAMACGALVLVSSPAFREALPAMCRFRENDPQDLADRIEYLLQMAEDDAQEQGRRLRRHVVEHHSLDLLVRWFTEVLAA
jgi:glycosyltransferase involved in cell wall biosynthesis